ncbi:MAG: hypothetical protein WA708_06310 [Acidobacteriaceae bacterium]
MPWPDAFRALKEQETFESKLLRDLLPLIANGQSLSPSLIERVSGVLASYLPRSSVNGQKNRLIFVLPNATQSLARFLAVSLLLADFVKRQSGDGVVIRGDLLLVTQQIRNCVNLLRDVAVRHRSERLPITEFWPIEVLSQYSPPPDCEPRVFVGNPGWSSVLGNRQPFGSVVIDVSHPRTSDHLETLLKQPSIASASTQILVIPPWEHDRISALAEKDRPSDLIWAWDPAAVEAIEDVLAITPRSGKKMPDRLLWLSDDPEVEDYLIEIHSLLVGAMRAGSGHMPGAVLGAWGTYHKLRHLAVPLVALEEERKGAYQTLTLQERIQSLEDEPPEGRGAIGSYLEIHWPRLTSLLKALYELLLRRKEPAKFYTLASVVDDYLENRREKDFLRLVAPTKHEGNMIATLLGDIVPAWAEALQSGFVSITTIKEEPRLIAEGSVQQTLLLGFRTSETRYLDVYPTVPIHVVVYPYEAEIDDKIQQRIHKSIENLQDNGPRTVVLKQLQLPVKTSDENHNGLPKSKRAETHRRFEIQPELQRRRFLDDQPIEPFNLQKIITQNWFEEVDVSIHLAGGQDRRILEYCEIVDTVGDRYSYPLGRLIDVFRPAIEQKERIAAGDLEPGMLMVVLVDDPYEDIFERMLEAIGEQRDLGAQMALALWDHAKPAALTKFRGNRRQLHRSLETEGISVDYSAVVGWYRKGEDEIIAPQKREDFDILARASGLYADLSRMEATFNCIQRERAVRRTCGRKLSNLLTHLAAGQHYEVALKSADAIGTALEQVAAAVSLREIESVRKLGKGNFMRGSA